MKFGSKEKAAVTAAKKKLMLGLGLGVIAAVLFVTLYFIFRRWELTVCAILIPIFIIGHFTHAYLKEKRQNKNFEKEKQDFQSGAKYRSEEWKAAFDSYKQKQPFEDISPKGMKYDLVHRYRADSGFGAVAWSLLFILSAAAAFYPIKGWNFGYSILGVVFGGYLSVRRIYNFSGGPVKKLYKTRNDISEIERSYAKGKMMSYGENGINIGSSYTVIYKCDDVIPIDNNTILSVTRKMVRVKVYDNRLYSGQVYDYYVHIVYTDPDGDIRSVDVKLDEFRCEMILEQFDRIIYPERPTAAQVTEKTIYTVS